VKKEKRMPKTAAANQTSDNDQTPTKAVTNRHFVQMVRARLDADGHRDIPVSRQWIDEDEPGYPFLLNVPVGSELVVPLKPREAFFRTEDVGRIDSHAEHFAKALVTLRQAERMLVKYACDVRRAAAKVIADARAEGLDVLLADVTFKPTCAWQLTGSSWKDAANHILASVKVRNTSFYLQPKISEVYVKEPADVAKELKDLLEDERERLARLAYLDGLGADLHVDAITLDLLRTHVVDVEQVLREAWKRQHVSIPIVIDGYETHLSLITSDGRATAGVQLPDAFWNGEQLWMTNGQARNAPDLTGKTLAGLVAHPALACRTIVRMVRSPDGVEVPDVYHLDTSETFLFDADTGRIWPQEAVRGLVVGIAA
jgi:hypothetical protein